LVPKSSSPSVRLKELFIKVILRENVFRFALTEDQGTPRIHQRKKVIEIHQGARLNAEPNRS
jgi:hypothetical protein